MRKRVVFLMLILSICLIFATGCFDDVSYLTVRFDSNNGTQITELQVESGAKVSRPEDPVKEHYVFDGWYNGDTEWVFETDTVEFTILDYRKVSLMLNELIDKFMLFLRRKGN